MQIGSWVSLIELTAVFGLVIGFGIWQLRSLDRLDREEAEARERDE